MNGLFDRFRQKQQPAPRTNITKPERLRQPIAQGLAAGLGAATFSGGEESASQMINRELAELTNPGKAPRARKALEALALGLAAASGEYGAPVFQMIEGRKADKEQRARQLRDMKLQDSLRRESVGREEKKTAEAREFQAAESQKDRDLRMADMLMEQELRQEDQQARRDRFEREMKVRQDELAQQLALKRDEFSARRSESTRKTRLDAIVDVRRSLGESAAILLGPESLNIVAESIADAQLEGKSASDAIATLPSGVRSALSLSNAVANVQNGAQMHALAQAYRAREKDILMRNPGERLELGASVPTTNEVLEMFAGAGGPQQDNLLHQLNTMSQLREPKSGKAGLQVSEGGDEAVMTTQSSADMFGNTYEVAVSSDGYSPSEALELFDTLIAQDKEASARDIQQYIDGQDWAFSSEGAEAFLRRLTAYAGDYATEHGYRSSPGAFGR